MGNANYMTDQRGERMMDRLSGAGFLGAVLGAWLGVLAGLLLALFLPTVAWLPTLLGGMLVGAAAGAGIGLLTYLSTERRRGVAGRTDAAETPGY